MGPEVIKRIADAETELDAAKELMYESGHQLRREVEQKYPDTERTNIAPQELLRDREASYQRLHAMLRALWNAGESSALGPHVINEGSSDISGRVVRAPGYPVIKLITDGTMPKDAEGTFSYGLIYDFNLMRDVLRSPEPMWGIFSVANRQELVTENGMIDDYWRTASGDICIYGDELEARLGGPSDKAHIYRDDSWSTATQTMATILEDLDTVTRLCEAAGVQVPEPVQP